MRRFAALRIGVVRLLVAALLGLFVTAFAPAAGARIEAARALSQSAHAARVPPTRLVFAATVAQGQTQIYSIDPSGRRPAELTSGSRPSSDPVPSPDGAHVAFERGGSLWVMRPDGRGQRLLARNAIDPAWTPDSRRIAYVRINDVDESLGIRVVGVGGGDRLLVRGETFGPAWSPDGRSLAFDRRGELDVLRRGRVRVIVRDPDIFRSEGIGWSFDSRWLAYAAAGRIDVVTSAGGRRRELNGAVVAPVWSPKSLLLAYVTSGGNFEQTVNVLAPTSGRMRTLGKAAFGIDSLAWSPRGGAVAFAGGFLSAEDLVGSSELGFLTLVGRERLLPASAYPLPDAVAWTTPAVGVRYRPPPPLGPLVSRDLVELREPVQELAADGDRVAYRSCGTIAVWRPGDASVVSQQVDRPLCGETNIGFYSLALAGDKIAWGSLRGGNVQTNALVVETVGEPATRVDVATGYHTTGDPRGDERAGDLIGAGSLLVFSTWAYCDEVVPATCPGLSYGQGPTIASEELWRVREPSWPGGCPSAGGEQANGRCQQLRAEPGPLRPLDADAGRIVVSGDNATLVLDGDGRQLLSLPLSTQAAELTGADLVVLVPGGLRDYDAATGALLHSWPLPDVASGGFCGVPVFLCGSPRLRLEDAAHGLVAYVLDGQIHLLRLADGRDVTLHDGSIARFDDGGLFYAYPASGVWRGRIRFVAFDQLPLR
jgi:Tol biopolymer transport system component